MNALVNYGTDSDSEDDDISPTHKTTRPANTQAQTTTNNNEDQDDPILAALKDLQDFAASVSENNLEPSSSNTTTADATAAGSGEPMEQDQDELQFLSFLQEIDAIPNPDDVQPPPPPSPPPPPPPPSEAPLAINNIPPPPPSSSITIASPPPTTSASMTTTESIHQSVQNIYNRLYYISLLPSASTVAQDLERRLLEFAIRIVDWTKGGLEEAYFLGQDLADALAQEAAAATGDEGGSTPEGVVADLPDFGGIVGSMIQYMFRLEQMITPNGWMAVWDTEDEAYGFQHVRTGLYSPVYPSTELITTLDPPAPATSKHARPPTTPTYKSNTSWNYYSSEATTTTTLTPSTYATTTTAPVLNPWAVPPTTTTTTSSPQSAGSEGTNSHVQSPSEPTFGTTKKKKRKIDDPSTPGDDSGALFDQSIHPSRRAALVKSGSGSPGSGGISKASFSSSSSSSKVMPKKLASLLQKWNEKDVEMRDDDEDDDNDQGHHQDLGNNRTGANSQSLGGGRRR